MANPVIFGIITALHDLFTAIWIGGLIFMGVILIPSILKLKGKTPEGQKIIDMIGKRLRYFVYVSIIGLIVTGILLSKQASLYSSPFSFANKYSIFVTVKHILIIPMVIIALVKSLFLDRKKEPEPTTRKIRMVLIYVNLLLGIVVLILSGLSAAYANIPVT
jgi:uncharacterized membrane protein